MSHHFELEDAPGYLAHFPMLQGKALVGRGEFSVVFEGSQPDTVLKLTVDQAVVDFLMQGYPTKREGLVEVRQYHGSMSSNDHGLVHLLELKRLSPITADEHKSVFFERNSVMATVTHRIEQSDRFAGIVEAQERHAGALQELAMSGLFSKATSKSLVWISNFLKSSPLDLMHDLCNPSNYMTDGVNLIITDPFIVIS